uniref:Uncharacterized protein n=1 Tax=Rhizophora mucronata TaxID=61149 RepID=A0A2P2PZK5_RHIMU
MVQFMYLMILTMIGLGFQCLCKILCFLAVDRCLSKSKILFNNL